MGGPYKRPRAPAVTKHPLAPQKLREVANLCRSGPLAPALPFEHELSPTSRSSMLGRVWAGVGVASSAPTAASRGWREHSECQSEPGSHHADQRTTSVPVGRDRPSGDEWDADNGAADEAPSSDRHVKLGASLDGREDVHGRDEEPARGVSDAGRAGRNEVRVADSRGSDGGADEGSEEADLENLRLGHYAEVW